MLRKKKPKHFRKTRVTIKVFKVGYKTGRFIGRRV